MKIFGSVKAGKLLNMRRIDHWVGALILLTASSVMAEEGGHQALDGAVIQGNQEQPKVLYIVPWQAPTSPELSVPKPEEKVEGTFQPIERDFYRQSLYFRRHLKIGVLPDQQ